MTPTDFAGRRQIHGRSAAVLSEGKTITFAGATLAMEYPKRTTTLKREYLAAEIFWKCQEPSYASQVDRCDAQPGHGSTESTLKSDDFRAI
jgi:hypothetical protein